MSAEHILEISSQKIFNKDMNLNIFLPNYYLSKKERKHKFMLYICRTRSPMGLYHQALVNALTHYLTTLKYDMNEEFEYFCEYRGHIVKETKHRFQIVKVQFPIGNIVVHSVRTKISFCDSDPRKDHGFELWFNHNAIKIKAYYHSQLFQLFDSKQLKPSQFVQKFLELIQYLTYLYEDRTRVKCQHRFYYGMSKRGQYFFREYDFLNFFPEEE